MKLSIKKNMKMKVGSVEGDVEVLLEDDVKPEDFNKRYIIMSKLADACLANDCSELFEEVSDASSNVNAYCKGLTQSKEKIKSTIKTLSSYLC